MCLASEATLRHTRWRERCCARTNADARIVQAHDVPRLTRAMKHRWASARTTIHVHRAQNCRPNTNRAFAHPPRSLECVGNPAQMGTAHLCVFACLCLGCLCLYFFVRARGGDTGIHTEGVGTQTETKQGTRRNTSTHKSLPYTGTFTQNTLTGLLPFTLYRLPFLPYTPRHRRTLVSSFACQAWFWPPLIPATREAKSRGLQVRSPSALLGLLKSVWAAH